MIIVLDWDTRRIVKTIFGSKMYAYIYIYHDLSTRVNVMVIRRFCLEDDEKEVFWVKRFHVVKNKWLCTSIEIVFIKVGLMVNDVLYIYIYCDHNMFYKGLKI